MIIKDIPIYTGVELHKRFAYKYFRKGVNPAGDIIAFIAPAKVELEGLIDLEDSLSNDFISSDSMIHFMWEIPIIQDGVGAIAFQRLFITQVAGILHSYIGAPILVEGDDLMVQKEHNGGGIIQQDGKASVSITYCKDQVTIGHLGINIVAGKKAPAFAFSTNLALDEQLDFINSVTYCFYYLIRDLFTASSKVQIP